MKIDDKAIAKRRKLLVGIGGSSLLCVWHKPIIQAVMTPVHAQTSVVCPMVVTGNVVTGPVSGNNTPPVCTATFDVLSSDPMTDLTISAIDTATLPPNVTIEVQDLGVASTVAGPRVIWRGPASDAPFCSDLMPIDDVMLTVTASCAGNSMPFTQTLSLSAIVAP